MHDEINDRMQKWRGTADTYLMPPQVIRFLNLVPSENIRYQDAGPAGPGRLEDSTKPWGVLSKQPVYLVRSYFGSAMEGNRQWLEDRKGFGEWYRMSNPKYSPDCPYRSSHRNIQIYSFPQKKFVEITLKDALRYSLLFDSRTRLPMYLDDPAFPYQSHLEGKHAQRDIFHYKSVDGSAEHYKKAHFFGEMELHYFQPEDKIALAHGVMGALRKNLADCNRTICDFNDGIALLKRIQRLPFTLSSEPIFRRIVEATVDVPIGENRASPRGLNTIASLTPVPEYTQDPNSGFLQFTTEANTPGSADYLELPQLIPGLQSTAGLQFLIDHGTDALKSEKDIAIRFLAAARDMAAQLEIYFPDNVLLSPAYASPVQHYPTPASTLVDNLFLGGYNPPIWFTPSGVRAGQPIDKALQAFISSWGEADISIERTRAQGFTDKQAMIAFYMIVAVLTVPFEAGFFKQGDKNSRKPAWRTMKAIFGYNDIGADDNDEDEPNHIIDLSMFSGKSTSEIVRIVDQKINQALANPDLAPFFASLAPAAERENFLSLVSEAGDRLASAGEQLTGSWVRTPLLASSAFAATLYTARVNNPGIPVTISDPRFPEIPATDEILEEITRFYPGRVNITQAAREEAARALEEFAPAWNIRVSEKFPIGTNSVFNSVMSAHVGIGAGSEMAIGEIIPQETPLRSRVARLAEEYRRGASFSPEFVSDAVAAPNAVLSRLMGLGERFFSQGFSRSWYHIEKRAENPLIKTFAHLYDSTPIVLDTLETWIDENIPIPFDLIVARPLIEVKCLTIMKAKAGRDTIITAMAPGQFETGDDPVTQWHVGSITGRHKCMVISPENFYIWKGAFICGVVGGLGTEPINPADYDSGRGEYRHQDIMVIPLSPRDEIKSNLFSLTGDLAIAETAGLKLGRSRYQHENCARVNKAWGFNAARFGINEEESAVDSEIVSSWPNVLCHAGPFLSLDPKTEKYTVYHKGESYLTGLIHHECANVLMGRMEELDRDPWTGYTRA